MFSDVALESLLVVGREMDVSVCASHDDDDDDDDDPAVLSATYNSKDSRGRHRRRSSDE